MKMKCPKLKKRYDNIGYLFVLPAFALFMIFAAVPACLTFRIAFYEWDFLSPDMTFVGVENFVKLFEDENFRTVIGNTFYFTVVTVLAKVGLGVILANFVASRVRNRVGQFVMESALFMPIVIPMSVVALVFNKMYDYEFGVLNGILRIFGLGPVGWLTDADIALNSVMLVDIFKGVGFFFIIGAGGDTEYPQGLLRGRGNRRGHEDPAVFCNYAAAHRQHARIFVRDGVYFLLPGIRPHLYHAERHVRGYQGHHKLYDVAAGIFLSGCRLCLRDCHRHFCHRSGDDVGTIFVVEGDGKR